MSTIPRNATQTKKVRTTAFQTADPRRRSSDEVDYGATWRAAGSDDAWRLAWLRETGELYLCQAGGYPGPSANVHVLAVRDKDRKLVAILFGYACHNTTMDYLRWSGDYAGFAQIALEERHKGAVAMFWAGCGGRDEVRSLGVFRGRGVTHGIAIFHRMVFLGSNKRVAFAGLPNLDSAGDPG